jgi:DNA segregation ATPase FtsK/SpoIIIE, S-DNA-T family
MFTAAQRRQLIGLALFALAIFTALSLVPLSYFGAPPQRLFPAGNIMGVLGSWLAAGGFASLGIGILGAPVLLGVGAAGSFGLLSGARAVRWAALVTGLMFWAPTTLALFAAGTGFEAAAVAPAAAAGWLGRTVALPLVAFVGFVGALLALTVALAALIIATVGWSTFADVVRGVRSGRRGRDAAAGHAGAEPADEAPPAAEPLVASAAASPAFAGAGALQPAGAAEAAKPMLGLAAAARKLAGAAKRKSAEPVLEDVGDPENGDVPPLELLSTPPGREAVLSEVELDRLGQVLIQTLGTFKVEGAIHGRTTGPVVTQFEVVPAPGVKVNRIAALDADLALALRAPSIRIVAPIPGKGAVGVEVPNPEAEVVYLRRILEAPAYQRGRGQLPLALGKDLTGKPYVADLARMPHLLIAGATGSGKSICINTLITSLIYRHSPRTLRLLLVDPKMVELSMYSDLPHLRHPVVTDPQDASTVLKWAVLEMERRYALLSVNGARSLAEFNKRAEDGKPLKRAEPAGIDGDPDRYVYDDGPLPYIVVVVDELADLMMSVQSEVERPLAQLAQKARAIGIHLIVATQRPSVNVITGLIKANFPCRIAFRVASKVDSRTILDQNGADALLGNGDMLFLPPGTSDPVRIQGAYLSTEDTDAVMDWYRERQGLDRAAEDDILEVVRSREASEATEDSYADEDRDALFRQAAEICVHHQQGSTSLLQRRLRIGYGRAARIIDQLHNAGVLGPPDGSKPRDVLVGMESIEHICGDAF